MTSVTIWGWDIMITCEPSTSVISAWARCAIERITSAPAALSPVATTAQAGSAFQAGGRSGRLGEGQLGDGPLRGRHHRGLFGGQVGGEGIVEVCRIDGELDGGLGAFSERVLKRNQGGGQDAVLGGAFGIDESLALLGCEGRDEDEAHDVVGAGGGVADHGPPVGMPDGKHRAGNL